MSFAFGGFLCVSSILPFQLGPLRHRGGTWREMDILIPLGDFSHSVMGNDDI